MANFSEQELLADFDAAAASGDDELASHIAGKIKAMRGAGKPIRDRTMGEIAGDVGATLGGGVIDVLSTPFDLVAPQLGVGKASKEFYANALSDPTKERNKRAQAAVAKAAEGGLWEEGKEAVKQYGGDPVLAAQTVLRTAPSMLPTLAAAKVGQVLKLSGTALAAAVNAVQGGGGARGQAFEEIYKDEKKKGASDEDAKRTALAESAGPAVLGIGLGAAAGGSGVEAVVAGGAKKGAKEGLKRGLTELATEEAEELLPQAATNYAVDKPLTEGLPTTAVQTAIGASPGSAMAGLGSLGKEAPTTVDPNVAAEAAGAVTPEEPGVIDPDVPPQGELPFQPLVGGAQGGIMQGTNLEVDENGMPIDVKGSLELQQTERGEVGVQEDMFAKEPKDISEALHQEAIRNRERAWAEMEQQASVGPPEPEHLVAERKRVAFEVAERANAAWKKATEEGSWKDLNWKAIEEAVRKGERDTAMGQAMELAFGESLSDDSVAGTSSDARGDPLTFMEQGNLVTYKSPAKAFLSTLKRFPTTFHAIWEGMATEFQDWAKGTFGPLINEDSIRGDAVRRKLLMDAANKEVWLEAATQNKAKGDTWSPGQFRPTIEIDEKGHFGKGPDRFVFNDRPNGLLEGTSAERILTNAIDHANKSPAAPGLTGMAKYTKALRWVTTVLPYLTRNTKAFYVYDNKRALHASLYYANALKSGLSHPAANKAIATKFPEFATFINDDPNANLTGLFESAVKTQTNGFAWHQSKGPNRDRNPSVVFINNNAINNNPTVNLVGLLVHELTHAYHVRRLTYSRQMVKDRRNAQIDYWDRWTEKRARQAEETARIKYTEMYRAEFEKSTKVEDAMDLALGGSSRFKGTIAQVPGTSRANEMGGRNAGAVGESRLPSDASSYVNTREGARPGFKEVWPKDPVTGEVKLQEQGTYAIEEGKKMYGPKYFRLLSSLPNVDTTAFLEALGDVSKDIWNNWGIRTGTYRGVTPTLLNPTTGDFVYAHVTQKFVAHAATEHANNAKSRQAWETLEAHYSADSKKLFGKLDIGTPQVKSKREAGAKAFAKDAKVVLWFEKNPDAWFDGQNYYPTVQQMVDQGLSPEAAKVWRGVMDQYEQLWDTLEDAVGVAGRHAVARVPGYMPHTTIGQYKALAVTIDPKTGDTLKYHAEIGAATEKEALRNLELLKKYFANQKVSFVMQPPEPGKYDVASVLEGLRKARDLAGNIEGLKKLAEIIESNAARGVITHALDRGDVARFGHTLQRATFYGTDFGMDLRGQMEAVRGFREYVKAVNGYTERVKFVRDTLGPLDMSGALDLPNLREAIYNNFKDYVGIGNVNKLDTTIKSGLVRMGLDPRLVDTYVNQTQSGMAAFYLIGNVPFYVVNSVQATASMPLLFAKQAELRLQGQTKIPDMTTAMSRGMKRMKNIWSEQSRLADPALRWAEEHGYLDPQAHEAMQPNAVGIPRDPITAGIDRKTRQIAFVIGYEFYRQTFDHETSLHKAGAFSKEVAVPYEKSVGKPSILNRLPVVGQAATLFTTYPVHILSMLENQTKMMVAAKKAGDYKAMRESLTGMLSYVALQGAMFGLMGLPFAGFLSAGADELNKFLGKPIVPNVQRLARLIDKSLETNGLAQFGVISKTLGYDISSSAQGVQPTIPTAAFRAVEIMFTAAILTAGAFVGKTSQQDVWEFSSKLPGQWRGPADWILRDYPETTAQEHFREKGEPRTVADQWIMALHGVRSTQEKSQMITEQLLKTDQEIIAKRLSSISSRMKNKAEVDEKTQKELIELANDFQIDPTSVINGFVTWMETKDLSPDLRKAMRANSNTGAANYQRFLKERSMEPTRPQ